MRQGNARWRWFAELTNWEIELMCAGVEHETPLFAQTVQETGVWPE